MIETLIHWDTELFQLINGWNTPWADQFMYLVSTVWFWIPFYAVLLVFIVKKVGWKSTALVLPVVALMITISDQTASGFLKPAVKRYRPCKIEAGLDFEVHTVNGKCGRNYGFVSSHAANFFALATFFSLFFRRRALTFTFLSIATLVAYSRVYLGVHYPGDVIGGGLVGATAALLAWQIYRSLYQRFWPAR